MDHYRCIKCYFLCTREVRDCDTVKFFPHVIIFPRITLKDHLKQVAEDMITILIQPPKNNVPSIKVRDPTRNAILQIAKLLKRVERIPEPVEEVIYKHNILAPRVKPTPILDIVYNSLQTATVIPCNTDEITADVLQQHRNLLKNTRFQN